MNSSTDTDLSKGAVSDNPVSTGALQNFMQGLKEKIGPEFGRVCSEEERHEVRREIARELGVEDDYEYGPETWPDPDESGATARARRKVLSRYNELEAQGKIVEAGQLAELQEWAAEVDDHLRIEEDSEDPPDADRSRGEHSPDPREGVGPPIPDH